MQSPRFVLHVARLAAPAIPTEPRRKRAEEKRRQRLERAAASTFAPAVAWERVLHPTFGVLWVDSNSGGEK